MDADTVPVCAFCGKTRQTATQGKLIQGMQNAGICLDCLPLQINAVASMPSCVFAKTGQWGQCSICGLPNWGVPLEYPLLQGRYGAVCSKCIQSAVDVVEEVARS